MKPLGAEGAGARISTGRTPESGKRLRPMCWPGWTFPSWWSRPKGHITRAADSGRRDAITCARTECYGTIDQSDAHILKAPFHAPKRLAKRD